MEIIYDIKVKEPQSDGSAKDILSYSSPYRPKPELRFLEEGRIYEVMTVKKLPGSNYGAVGGENRQRFSLEVLVKPIDDYFKDYKGYPKELIDLLLKVRELPTGSDLQIMSRIYCSEAIQGMLLKPASKDLYG